MLPAPRCWTRLERSFWSGLTSITKPEKTSLACYGYNPKYLIKNDVPNSVVLLHGLYTSKEYLRDLTPLIATSLCWPVYSLDLCNHGESGHRVYHGRATLVLAAHDVLHFIDDLQLAKVMLMGIGFAARVAIQMTRSNPNRVEHLVTFNLSQDGTLVFARYFPRYLYFLNDLNSKPTGQSLSIAKLTMKEMLRGQVGNAMTLKFILENIRLDRNGRFKWKLNERTLELMLRNWNDVMFINYEGGKHCFEGEMLNIVTRNSYLTSEDYLDIKSNFDKQRVEYLNTRHLIHRNGSNLLKILQQFRSKSTI